MTSDNESARSSGAGRSVALTASILLLSYVALAIAAIRLPSAETGLSPFWYANAVAALILLARPARQWPVLTAFLTAAIVTVNVVSGTELVKLLIYLCSNLVDVLLAATMIRYVCRIEDEWSGATSVFKVLFYGGIVPALVSSLLGTTLNWVRGPTEFLDTWMIWFESNVLGYISLLPVGVIVLTRGAAELLEVVSRPVSLLWLSAVTVCVLGAPFFADYPYVYISTLLFIVGSRGSLPLAAIAVLLASVVLGALTATEVFVPVNFREIASLNSAYLPLILVLVPPILFAASIEEGRQQFEEISRLAHTDPLTSLSNRSVLEEEISRACEDGRRHGDTFAVLYMDLDGFKGINDTYGHSVGDLVLKTVAERVMVELRTGDVVSRLGGDEFAILINRINRPSDADMVARKLLEAVSKDIALDQSSVGVGASIGIAVFPKDGQTTSELLKRADQAMYTSKASGRGTYRHFEGSGAETPGGVKDPDAA